MRTALLAPVPEASATERFWPLWEPPHQPGIPPHVTVVFPFLRPAELTEEVMASLRAAIRRFGAFDVTFRRVGRFPATVWLAPDPAGPFVELTRAVGSAIPGTSPYGGAHEKIVPHLTVATGSDPEMLDRIAGEAASLLPLHAHIHEIWLMATSDGRWEPHTRFPLGPPRTSG